MEPKLWPKPARASFEAKVVVLELWAESQRVPENAPPLASVNDFRLWEDDERGLSSWSSFSVAAPGGPNADLRVRLDAVFPLIAALRAGNKGPPRKPRRGKPIPQIQIERERNRLAAQNEELLAARDGLRAEVIRLQQILAIKDAEYQQLLSKYNKLAPFGKR